MTIINIRPFKAIHVYSLIYKNNCHQENYSFSHVKTESVLSGHESYEICIKAKKKIFKKHFYRKPPIKYAY